MKWNELIKINKRFQNSVNIRLDLKDDEKIKQYIPTTASLEMLDHYLDNVQENKENTTILIGPYGKGKSHLLLLLLKLLWKEEDAETRKAFNDLFKHVKALNPEVAQKMKTQYTKGKPYLPVVVTYGNEDLNSSYLFGLFRALKLAGLEDLAPDNVYRKAEEAIDTWEREYPDTYATFAKKVGDIDGFRKELKENNKATYEIFTSLYPSLTAGSTFNPMVDMDAVTLYEDVDRVLRTEYNYAGVFLVFDEFSKYIEMQDKKERQLSGNMGLIQSMGELCFKKDNQMHQIFVAHKAIKEYGDYLSQETINCFTGVEGRIEDVLFSSNIKNNYELISQTVSKTKKGVEYVENLDLSSLLKIYDIPVFSSIFEKQHFIDLVVKGCCPLYPLTTYFLIKISEKVGQNERSLFTFLAKDEQYALPNYMMQPVATGWVRPYAVFDYFANLFQKEMDSTHVKSEYQKAQYAVQKLSALEQGKGQTAEQLEIISVAKEVVKVMALVLMLHLPEEVSTDRSVLQIACGIEEEMYAKAIALLEEENLIVWRNRTSQYQFKNQIGVDVHKELMRIKHSIGSVHMEQELSKIVGLRYELPKKYNLDKAITRYFDYVYLNVTAFLKMNEKSVKQLFEERFSDGKIIALLTDDKSAVDEKIVCSVAKKTKELDQNEIVVILPTIPMELEDLVKEYMAVAKYEESVAAHNDLEEQLLLEELRQMKDDYGYMVRQQTESLFMPYYGNSKVYHCAKMVEMLSDREWNEMLSQICASQFQNMPVIRHEMVNRQHPSSQMKKARNIIVDTLLQQGNLDALEEGTSPEATIYRATLYYTGIYNDSFPVDAKVQLVLDEIDDFLGRAEEEKIALIELYQVLEGKGYGIRRGVIPIYIAQRMQRLSKLPVVYAAGKEYEISADVLSKANEQPEKYSLSVEKNSTQKEIYFKQLCQLWNVESAGAKEVDLKDAFCDWFWSLPQYSIRKSYEEQPAVAKVCKHMLTKEMNPREFIYEVLPVYCEAKDYTKVYQIVEDVKQKLDSAIEELYQGVLRDTKVVLGDKESDGFMPVLADWYHFLSAEALKQIHDTLASGFLSVVADVTKRIEAGENLTEKVVLNRLAKVLVDLHLEDWQENTHAYYLEQLSAVVSSYDVKSSNSSEVMEGKKQLQFTGEDGKEIQKYYSDEINGTAEFLQNEMLSVLEEFGESVEPEEKVAVLMKLLEEIVGK